MATPMVLPGSFARPSSIFGHEVSEHLTGSCSARRRAVFARSSHRGSAMRSVVELHIDRIACDGRGTSAELMPKLTRSTTGDTQSLKTVRCRETWRDWLTQQRSCVRRWRCI